MPVKPCSVCTSGLKARVDGDLESGLSVRDIASATGIAKSVIGRHKINCWKGVPKKESTWGEKKKATEKILRVEGRKDKYIQAIGQEIQNGNLEIIEGEVEELPSSLMVPGFGLVKCPIRDSDDLVGKQYDGLLKVWGVLSRASEQYEADPTPGKARVVLMAFHEWNSGLMAIGKVKGIVTDSPQTTNQTLNVYAQLSDADLAKKKSEIKQLIALATDRKESEVPVS